MEFLYPCWVPTGKKGEYDCNRVFTRKNGEPAAAPRIPELAPERIFTPRDWTLPSLKIAVVKPLRTGS